MAFVTLLCGALATYPVAGFTQLSNNLPTLGDSASEDLSPAMERKLGEEIMREARADGDIWEDAPSTEYLNQFGANLIAHAPPGTQPIEFFLLRDPGINAFALPGGFIAVYSGLIIVTQSESELASVMCHEMGHVIQRHVARGMGHDKQTSLIALAGMLLGALAIAKSGNPSAGEASIMMSQNYMLHSELAFSRDAEREADRVGFQILQEAGFDVTAMPEFFLRLQQATAIYENGAPEWLHNHPVTTERIADIQGRIHDAPYHQRPDSLDFNLIRARLRVLQAETVQELRDVRTGLEDQIKTGKYANAAAIHYGLSLVRMQQKDYAGAQTELARVRSLVSDPDFIVDSLAVDIKLAAKDVDGAIALAHTGLARFPQSRSLSYQYVEALQQAARHPEAIEFLRDQIAQYHSESKLYDLLAKSYEAQGKSLLEHQALAEEYYLKGSVRAAIEQLNLARRSEGGDFYALSEIDARLKELKAEWADLQKDGSKSGG